LDMNKKSDRSFILRVLLKAFFLFLVFNFLFIKLNDFPIGKITLYNRFFSGRERLPFGENPSHSYNLTINNFDAMFSSLALDQAVKNDQEFRVFVIGDSSVWGSLQSNSDTLAAQLNAMQLSNWQGKKIKVFNLGYPSLSILKDLLIIDRCLSYQPDLIIWMTTLESFPIENQTSSQLLKNNPQQVNRIIKKYGLSDIYQFEKPSVFSQTFLGQRRNIADMIRLQEYGFMWAATGIDQDLKSPFTGALRDFDPDEKFHSAGYRILEPELSLEIIERAKKNISIPIILVNEPILISRGRNCQIRYNYYYPRWTFDQFRVVLKTQAIKVQIPFYDFYDLVPDNLFTNSAIHLNREGESILAERIASIITMHGYIQ
jgi:hypothetical protein